MVQNVFTENRLIDTDLLSMTVELYLQMNGGFQFQESIQSMADGRRLLK